MTLIAHWSSLDATERIARLRSLATIYRLTFYPLANGTPATNRWKAFTAPKSQKSAPTNAGRLPPQMQADSPNLPPQMQADSAPTNAGPSISTPWALANGAPPGGRRGTVTRLDGTEWRSDECARWPRGLGGRAIP